MRRVRSGLGAPQREAASLCGASTLVLGHQRTVLKTTDGVGLLVGLVNLNTRRKEPSSKSKRRSVINAAAIKSQRLRRRRHRGGFASTLMDSFLSLTSRFLVVYARVYSFSLTVLQVRS